MESQKKSIFEKIIDGEIASEKVYETDRVLAIKDIAPKAPVHILIIPKKAIPSLQEMKEEEMGYLIDVAKAAQEIARKFHLVESGYRLLVNQGADAGQTIFHIHFHLLGGAPLGDMG